MGQYYRPVLTKNGKTTLFGNQSKNELTGVFDDWHGLKIMEHSWIGNELVDGIAQKLYNRKGRVAWVGDYTSDIMNEVVSTDGTKAPMSPDELYYATLFQRDEDGNFVKNSNGYRVELNKLPKDVKKSKCVKYNGTFKMVHKFLINLTKKEYIDMDAYISRSMTKDGWCIHPLPLMTSTGGDQGGGDYHEGYICQSYVGEWAYDEITIKDKAPKSKDFTLLNVTFSEEIEAHIEGVC